MPSKMVLIDFEKCNPQQCGDGVCLAALACERKLLIQEKPFEIPMANPSICRACGDCVRACPLGAVRIVKI